MYAALIQGRLHEIRDDIPFVKNGMSLTPGSPEYIAFRASLGYLPYVPATPPEPETDYHYEAAYAIVDGVLVQSWNKVADPSLVVYLRNQYRTTTNNFCQLAGIEIVNKFEDSTTIIDTVNIANVSGDIMLALKLTQAAVTLQNLIIELRRIDGDDAWERI